LRPQPRSKHDSDRMKRVRRRDTSAELRLRSALHRAGLRFRVDRPIRRAPLVRADIVFVTARVAIFIDGCFWHGCPLHATESKTNAPWWRSKIARNQQRDRAADELLGADGWTVLRFWEHEDPAESLLTVRRVLSRRA
jgi:DNA mismatch endonuclease, patch repair protein